MHGAGSNADFWHWQRSAFPHAHYPDLPRHGRHPEKTAPLAPTGPQLIEVYADWLANYIEEAGLEDVIVNGHSMGGAVALALALRHPVWLRGIVLTGSGAYLHVSTDLLHLLRTNYAAAVDAIIETSFAPPNGPLSYIQKARLNGTRRQLLRTPQEVTLADYEAANSFDVRERLGEIDVPALCIVGGQDAVTPPAYSEYMHRAIRGSQLRVVEGAGHMLPLERPEEYNSILAAFVEGLSVAGQRDGGGT